MIFQLIILFDMLFILWHREESISNIECIIVMTCTSNISYKISYDCFIEIKLYELLIFIKSWLRL